MNNSKEVLVKDILKEMKEENLAIFAGAGMSVPSGYVNWADLLRPIAEELGLQIEKEHDLVSLAQYHCNENASNRSKLNQLLIDEFSRNVKPSENHRILSRLPIQTFWTTNYDKLIEKSLEEAGKNPDVKYTNNQLAITKPKRDAIVYKMHGDVDHPDRAILTKDDYESYHLKMQPFLTALSGDLVSKTFLFIGFSFTDPNLDYILSRVRISYNKNQRRHYCFLRKIKRIANEAQEDFEYRLKKQEYFIQDLKRFNIKSILIEEFSEITGFLKVIEKSYRRNSIFISGAAHEYGIWGKDKSQLFIYELSQSIIKNGFKIVSGFGLGVGNAIISGALQEIYMYPNASSNEQLILRPFPQKAYGTQDESEIWARYRSDMISYAGIAIFLFGNKLENKIVVSSTGMQQEFEIAKSKNLFLLPIGATGYMAKTLWEKVISSFDDYCPGATDKVKQKFIELGKDTKKPKEIIDRVLKILKELIK